MVLTVPALAQSLPVEKWADWSSYGTAAANPASAVYEAFAGEHKGCDLARLAVSEAVGNVTTLTIKHYVTSPRPCLGCVEDGMPSGHTMNSVLGSSFAWRGLDGWKRYMLSASLVAATGILRHEANRHYWKQILAGAAIGGGAEFAGRLVRCES